MTTLHLLGCGTPTPTADRFGTSFVLNTGDDMLMFDCGPSTTHKLVKAGFFPTQITHLFFTHHHFDHNADYPCFLLCRWDQSIGKERNLIVRGPEPTAKITEGLVGRSGVFADDISARINHPTSQSVYQNRGGVLPRPWPSIDVSDIQPGTSIKGKNWNISTGLASHVKPWLTSLGYRVEMSGGTIVFIGDTQICDSVLDLSRGCDVLVVSCWDHQKAMESNGEGPAQTGTIDAARMALEAGSKVLILTHTGANLCNPGSRERAIADISKIFPGTIIFGEELMSIRLW
jgi:ribonuclease Z